MSQLEKLKFSQDLGGWLKSWDEIEGTVGASIAVGSRAARVNCGFLETPAAATWTMRLHEAKRKTLRSESFRTDEIHLCFKQK